MTVMIIEDNVNMRTFITQILERELPDVTTIILCDNGKKAIELYHKNNPDWVVMDIDIKNMDGLSATQRIIEIMPTAKIIMLSQYGDLEYKKAAIKLGALDCINKDNLGQITKIISQ
ncbi:response regulator [candidate division KSB1 bacterium]|nr:response regulator [candidate division KSB1 bacterium]